MKIMNPSLFVNVLRTKLIVPLINLLIIPAALLFPTPPEEYHVIWTVSDDNKIDSTILNSQRI
ncbi:hypothetical protein C2W64_01408 [Brevibacillus laterosporus]|nr:hypothetical protein C2W64_01408 [Brevibacillus laterosporus]